MPRCGARLKIGGGEGVPEHEVLVGLWCGSKHAGDSPADPEVGPVDELGVRGEEEGDGSSHVVGSPQAGRLMATASPSSPAAP